MEIVWILRGADGKDSVRGTPLLRWEPKDVQEHLGHSQAGTTLGIYVQSIPASVRAAVHSLDAAIFGTS